MRIVFNAMQAGNRSGTGRYTTELLHALLDLSPKPDITVVWPSHVMTAGLEHRTTLLRYGANPVQRIIAEQRGLRSVLRFRPDVLHYPANFGPALAQKGLVVTVHDLGFLRCPEWFPKDRAWYYRLLAKRTAHTASRVIADSHATREDLMALTKMPADRIDVIPLGVSPHFRPQDAAAQAEVRARHGLPEQFFLYVGTLEPRKNLPRLIAAYARIAKDTHCDLVIAGREGWKVDTMRAAVAESGCAERIHFPGYLPQEALPAALSAARAFVWPSLFEGFGLPPLEAMASGCPVLTSNTSSLPEVTGDAALLVDPQNIDAIADALLTLGNDDARCADLRARGLQRALQFTWARTAQETLETYRRVQ